MRGKRRFTKMYQTYADDIYRFLFVHVRDVEVAEDLTADTFTKAWKHIEKYDFKHPRGWLYAIARNTLTDYWRKKKPPQLDDEIEIADNDTPTQDELMDVKLEKIRVAKSLNRLPHDMKSVVHLRFMQGYSVRQTAEALDFSEANVRVIQYRALKRMKKDLS